MGGWDKAIVFVRRRGNRLDQLRLRRALAEPYTPVEAEEVLASYQFPDGSWDYNAPEEKSERIGSLGGMIHCPVLADAHLDGSKPLVTKIYEKAITFWRIWVKARRELL